jgi:cardiolipin synthase A/B
LYNHPSFKKVKKKAHVHIIMFIHGYLAHKSHLMDVDTGGGMHHRFSSPSLLKAALSSIITLIVCLVLIGCSSISIATGNAATGSTTNAAGGGSAASSVASGVQGVQVFVEPNAGDGVITDAIAGAKKTILLEMYLLTERKVISALEEAAQRGIDVHVLLEQHPYGSSSAAATETLDRLKAAGVNAQPTNPAFALTHEKGMVIDGNTAYIMTANFTAAALGSGSYTKNREYGIIDTNAQDVQAVTDIFNADWNRNTPQLHDPNLVVSPINARTAFTALINSAHKTLLIEAEEMQDSGIEQAITNAERRGVTVQVILPSSASSTSGDSNSGGISTISHAGVQVKEDAQLYMHAKIIIVDGQKAFVGSENISTASLEDNRELGILVSDPNVLNTLQQTFQQDWGISAGVT